MDASAELVAAIQRNPELVAAMRERDQTMRRLEALDRRIAELFGLAPASESRKPSRKTLSPKDFTRGCGI